MGGGNRTWKKWEKSRPLKKKSRAYLNYDSQDEKSYVHLIHSIGGYINVQFDYRVTYDNLKDLLSIVDQIDCNLWQLKPKHVKVDEEYLEKYKPKK